MKGRVKKPHQIHVWVLLCSQAHHISFPCLLSEHGWTGHQWRRHCSCHWRKRGWLVDSRKEWAARLCARVLPRKALMKRSPSRQTLKIFYYWKQTAHKVCFSWPRATHNTVFYNYQSGNNQLTTLSSSFLLPHPSTSWPTLSAKTVFTSERLGLVFLTTVLPTLSTLCCHQCCKAWWMWEENPAQNLIALKENDQGNKRCFSRMEACLQPACKPPSWSQQPCSLPWIPFSHCTGHASVFDRGVESTQLWSCTVLAVQSKEEALLSSF